MTPPCLQRFAFAGLTVASALVLAACLVDLSGLTGGTPDGGAPDGGSASSSGGGGGNATSASSSAGGMGPGGSTSTASGSSSSSSSASSGSGGGGGCGPVSVLDCGACACPGGNCPPIQLATGQDADTPVGIAVSADGIFWVDKANGQVMGMLAAGGGPQVLTTAMQPVAISAASGRIFYTAQDGLWTCPLLNCSMNKTNLDGPVAPGSMQGVLYDGKVVFWSDRGSDFVSANGYVKRCAWPSCTVKETVADNQALAQGLALNVDSVFWTTQGNGNQNGGVHKAPRVGFGVNDIAGSLDLPTGVAADDMYVYWTEAKSSGHILRCVHNSGVYCDNPTNIVKAAGALGTPTDIGIAGTRLYFSNRGDGTILSCPLPGCPDAVMPKVHATGRTQVQRIGLGTGCLFWTDQVNGGTVDKLPR